MQELGKPHVHEACQLLATWCQINRCSVHGMTSTDHFVGLNNYCTDYSDILGTAEC